MLSNPKRSFVVICVGVFALIATGAEAGIGNRWGPPGSTLSCEEILDDYFESLPVNILDAETVDRIILLREEEKLARDVYLTLSLQYDLLIFSNIARSEQYHMDLVAKLLDRYSPDYDPAEGNKIGEFENQWVQRMFNFLTTWGERSLLDALRVGVRVEDIDIFHLEYLLDISESYDDVSVIVQNLNAGSRNHMRSFVGALDRRDALYEIIYIPELIEAILNSDRETAVVYDENGDVLAECGRSGELEP